MLNVTVGDCFDSRGRVFDLLDPALIFQHLYSCGCFVARKMLNGLEQFSVFLPHDLIEQRGFHSGFLQLLERFAGLHALMLAGVADE